MLEIVFHDTDLLVFMGVDVDGNIHQTLGTLLKGGVVIFETVAELLPGGVELVTCIEEDGYVGTGRFVLHDGIPIGIVIVIFTTVVVVVGVGREGSGSILLWWKVRKSNRKRKVREVPRTCRWSQLHNKNIIAKIEGDCTIAKK